MKVSVCVCVFAVCEINDASVGSRLMLPALQGVCLSVGFCAQIEMTNESPLPAGLTLFMKALFLEVTPPLFPLQSGGDGSCSGLLLLFLLVCFLFSALYSCSCQLSVIRYVLAGGWWVRGHHICHQHSAMELQHVAVGTVFLLILLSSGESVTF